MFRALLTDLGGVWIQEGDHSRGRMWAADHGMTLEEVSRAYLDAIGPGWEGGRTEHEIHTRLLNACGVEVDELPALLEALHGHEVLDRGLSSLIAAQRAAGVKVGVITNAGPDTRRRLIAQFRLDELCDVIVISAEVGVAKPDPRIYSTTASLLGVRPDQCVFVDDKLANVETAASLGMAAVHFTNSADACSAITGLIQPRRS